MTFGKHAIRALLAILLLGTATAGFAATVTHTVHIDDTLWRIVQEYGTSVQSLQQLNGLGGNRILLGQKLLVSGTPNTVTTPTNTRTGKLAGTGLLLLARPRKPAGRPA